MYIFRKMTKCSLKYLGIACVTNKQALSNLDVVAKLLQDNHSKRYNMTRFNHEVTKQPICSSYYSSFPPILSIIHFVLRFPKLMQEN